MDDCPCTKPLGQGPPVGHESWEEVDPDQRAASVQHSAHPAGRVQGPHQGQGLHRAATGPGHLTVQEGEAIHRCHVVAAAVTQVIRSRTLRQIERQTDV